jgi:two-component system sensor histidine kinase/response regulator
MSVSISTATIALWQSVIDALAETLAVEAVFVASIVHSGDADEAEIRVSSRRPDHALGAGRRVPLAASWAEHAHVATLAWPDGAPFGVLALAHGPARPWTATDARLVASLRAVFEDHLASAEAAHERRVVAERERDLVRSLPEVITKLPLGAVLVRGDAVVLNAAAERITGHKQIVTLEDWFRLLFLNHQAEARAQHEIDRAAGFPVVSVRNIVRPDGRTRLVEIAGARLLDDEVWFLRDVTGEEASAVALRESDERFRAVTDTAPVIIYTGDDEKGLRFMNRAGLDFYGLTLEQAQGTATYERVHPEDWPRCQIGHAQAATSKEAIEIEFRTRRADGRYRWMLGRITPRFTVSGEPAGVVGVLSDMTDRLEAEEQVRKLSERMQLAVDAAGIGIWSYEIESGASVWDERMRATYGWADGEVSADDMVAAFHPDDRDRVLAEWEAAMASGRFESEFRISRRAGDGAETVHVRSFARVMQREDGRPYRVIGASWDATQANMIQEELRRAKIQADAANRAKSEFLANMSHEIRTPMNGVIGMAEIVLGTELSREQREYVKTIRSSAESLLTIINDILDFSRMEAGKLELARQDFQLRAGLDDLLRPLMVWAGEKGLHLIGEVDESVPDLFNGPWERIRQVVTNLVGNAIKFTDEGEVRIHVGYEQTEGSEPTLRFSVQDTGVGLAPEELGRIFQPFEQLDGVHHPRSGTGLGLAISARLVEMMGGRIRVESRPGEGSTFHASMKVSLIARRYLPRATPVNGIAAVRPLSILLAEDHFVNRRVAETMLEKRGHTVHLAKTGREAVDLFQREAIDVVLMDVEMPDMDGLEATAAIRAIERGTGKRTPIVALTAYAMTGDGERFLAAGMDGYVTKPMDTNRLWEVIGSVMSESTSVPPEA